MYKTFIADLQTVHEKSDEEMSSLLGISRPTYVRLKEGIRQLTLDEFNILATLQSNPTNDSLLTVFGTLSRYNPKEVEDILETFSDLDMLSIKGKQIRNQIWVSCVRDDNKN